MAASMWNDPLQPPAALRTVRPGDYPYPGTVRAGVPPRVWVDAGEPGIAAVWDAAADGHLLAPVDIARTGDGHAVLLPLCPDRLVPRVAACDPLSPGEAVNIAVSLLRGAGEAAARDEDGGTWWLTDEGRPVLALGGGGSWREETDALLGRLAAAQEEPLAEALEDAAVLVGSAAPPRGAWEAYEQRLLDAAAPVALGRRAAAPARSAPVTASRMPGPDAAAPGTVAVLVDRLVQGFDGDLAARLRGLGERLRSHRPKAGITARTATAADPDTGAPAPADPDTPPDDAAPPTRRLAWLVAAGIAGVIVAGGALWPQDDDSAAAPASVIDTPSPTPTDPPQPSVPTPDAAPDPVDAATALLGRLTQCRAASDACEGVLEEPGRSVPAGVATGSVKPELSVLDEYGGVVVLRAEDTDDAAAPAQIVVIVRDGGGWLIRDVYDIAGPE